MPGTHEKNEIELEWHNTTHNRYGSRLRKTAQMKTLNAYMISNRTHNCGDALSWRGVYEYRAFRLVVNNTCYWLKQIT